jgi:hypothetical protein
MAHNKNILLYVEIELAQLIPPYRFSIQLYSNTIFNVTLIIPFHSPTGGPARHTYTGIPVLLECISSWPNVQIFASNFLFRLIERCHADVAEFKIS